MFLRILRKWNIQLCLKMICSLWVFGDYCVWVNFFHPTVFYTVRYLHKERCHMKRTIQFVCTSNSIHRLDHEIIIYPEWGPVCLLMALPLWVTLLGLQWWLQHSPPDLPDQLPAHCVGTMGGTTAPPFHMLSPSTHLRQWGMQEVCAALSPCI